MIFTSNLLLLDFLSFERFGALSSLGHLAMCMDFHIVEQKLMQAYQPWFFLRFSFIPSSQLHGYLLLPNFKKVLLAVEVQFMFLVEVSFTAASFYSSSGFW